MKIIRAGHIDRVSESESSTVKSDDSLGTEVGHLPMKPSVMQCNNYAIVDFAKNVDSLLHTGYRVRRLTGRDRQQQVCRDIISEDLINLGLAMPNCLANNITGHSCDPYVLLRDRRLNSLFLYCEHFGETRTG